MTTNELKSYVDRILGNSVRVLLPSYWWKRLFHQVADRIDEVEQSAAEMVEDAKMPIVASEKELNKLDLPKGSVAAVEEVGNASTIKISDCYFSLNWEEDWSKYTIVKGVEEKDNVITDNDAAVLFSASKEMVTKDALQVNKLKSGTFYYIKWTDDEVRISSLEEVNKALSSGKYRAINYVNGSDDYFIDDYFTFYSEKPQPSLYIKGETWTRLLKEGDATGLEVRELYIIGDDVVTGNVSEEYTAEQLAYNKETVDLYKQGKVSLVMNATITTLNLDISCTPLNYINSNNGTLICYEVNAVIARAMILVNVDNTGNAQLFSDDINGDSITVDSELSDTSTNPVQNKVITAALNDKADKTYVDEKVASISDGEDSEYPLFSVTTNKDGTWSYAEDNEVEDIFAYTALSIRVSIDGGKPSTITHSHEYIDGVKWIKLYGQGDGFLMDATLMGITKVTYKFSPSFTWQGFIESTCFQFDYETGDTAIVTIKMDMLKGFSEDGLEGALISSAEFPKITEFNELKESVDDKADKTYVDEALSKTQKAIRVLVYPKDLETLIQEVLADQNHAIDIDAERFEYVFGTFMKDNVDSLYYMDIALEEDKNEPPYWSLTERWLSGSEIGIEFTKKELNISTRDYTFTSIYLFYDPRRPDEYYMEAERWVVPESELKSSYTAYVDNAIANVTIQKVKTINSVSLSGEGNIELHMSEIHKKLQDIKTAVLNNEEVLAAALNDINRRLLELENLSNQ